ncbi:lipocalin family protein [Lutibacter sp.]|uniref:lipocalin family protein n=1 Tax=Lutibacter sp. TaxID=1925666 RepID=UPI00356B4B4E
MKKIKYFLIMVVAVMVSVSCSKDDNDVDDVNPLVGSWGIIESEQGLEINITATFNSNLTGAILAIVTFEGETVTENESFTWSTSGNKLTLVINGETEISTYSISDNKLTIIDVDGTTVLTRL